MEENKDKKIVLPKKLQVNMLEFFLKTSIPRNAEKNNLLSNKKMIGEKNGRKR